MSDLSILIVIVTVQPWPVGTYSTCAPDAPLNGVQLPGAPPQFGGGK
jgi:hypothetical protein